MASQVGIEPREVVAGEASAMRDQISGCNGSRGKFVLQLKVRKVLFYGFIPIQFPSSARIANAAEVKDLVQEAIGKRVFSVTGKFFLMSLNPYPLAYRSLPSFTMATDAPGTRHSTSIWLTKASKPVSGSVGGGGVFFFWAKATNVSKKGRRRSNGDSYWVDVFTNIDKT